MGKYVVTFVCKETNKTYEVDLEGESMVDVEKYANLNYEDSALDILFVAEIIGGF